MDYLTPGDKLQTIWKSYEIPQKFLEARLNNYYPRNNDQQAAADKCQSYSQQQLNEILKGKGLFIHCPITGTGKTHLAVATLYTVISSNVQEFGYKSRQSEYITFEESKIGDLYSGRYMAGFINITDLLTTLQDSFSGDDKARRRAVNMMHRAKIDDILILDDIGAMKPSEWVETQLYNLVDIRYRMERPMIFTSNCAIDDLEKQIGKRAASRIFEVTDGVWVPGPDYRKRKLA